MSETEPGTLAVGEPHPMAYDALAYINGYWRRLDRWMLAKEAMASTALSGSRAAEVCVATMNRIEAGQGVSDRYMLGLAWMLKGMEGAASKLDQIAKKTEEQGD